MGLWPTSIRTKSRRGRGKREECRPFLSLCWSKRMITKPLLYYILWRGVTEWSPQRDHQQRMSSNPLIHCSIQNEEIIIIVIVPVVSKIVCFIQCATALLLFSLLSCNNKLQFHFTSKIIHFTFLDQEQIVLSVELLIDQQQAVGRERSNGSAEPSKSNSGSCVDLSSPVLIYLICRSFHFIYRYSDHDGSSSALALGVAFGLSYDNVCCIDIFVCSFVMPMLASWSLRSFGTSSQYWSRDTPSAFDISRS